MSSRNLVVAGSTACTSGMLLTNAAEPEKAKASATNGKDDDALNSTTPSDGPTN